MYVFYFKQNTSYELRNSDWSSDVCSSELGALHGARRIGMDRDVGIPIFHDAHGCAKVFLAERRHVQRAARGRYPAAADKLDLRGSLQKLLPDAKLQIVNPVRDRRTAQKFAPAQPSSEEHTSELQSLMRNSYAAFCLKK